MCVKYQKLTTNPQKFLNVENIRENGEMNEKQHAPRRSRVHVVATAGGSVLGALTHGGADGGAARAAAADAAARR
jgi:hypothetical protein